MFIEIIRRSKLGRIATSSRQDVRFGLGRLVVRISAARIVFIAFGIRVRVGVGDFRSEQSFGVDEGSPDSVRLGGRGKNAISEPSERREGWVARTGGAKKTSSSRLARLTVAASSATRRRATSIRRRCSLESFRLCWEGGYGTKPTWTRSAPLTADFDLLERSVCQMGYSRKVGQSRPNSADNRDDAPCSGHRRTRTVVRHRANRFSVPTNLRDRG